jgi:hypothetical protein
MALIKDIDDSYTKTGKGGLTRWSNGLSFVPQWLLNTVGLGKDGLLSKIPVIGGSITAVLGYLDTAIEAGQWLLRGKFGSAATVAIAGAVATTVNAVPDMLKGTPYFWWANAASGLATGTSLGTHARAATEALIGGVTGAIGAKPQVLGEYPRVTGSSFGVVGSVGAGKMQSAPGKFASGVSAQRGENPDAAYARYMSGEGGVHVNELQSAYRSV